MIRTNYNAWNISEKNFPKKSSLEEQIKYLVRYGILAPSTHNTQPWKIEIQSNTLKISPNLSLRLAQTDPTDRNLFISLGCFLRNIEVAAAYFGFDVGLDIDSFGKLTTEIRLTFKRGKTNRELASLFNSIVKRFSNKTRYENKPVAKGDLDKLNKVKVGGARVLFVNDRNVIHQIAQIHGQSVAALSGNADFAKELARWLRPNNTEDFDGMPGFVVGLSDEQSIGMRRAIESNPAIFGQTAQVDVTLIMSSPVVGIVVSLKDDINAWIDVGRVYETVALKAVLLGLAFTPMQASVENKAGRKKLKEMAGLTRDLPQMFFRMGYNKVREYHTPRKGLDQLMR